MIDYKLYEIIFNAKQQRVLPNGKCTLKFNFQSVNLCKSEHNEQKRVSIVYKLYFFGAMCKQPLYVIRMSDCSKISLIL